MKKVAIVTCKERKNIVKDDQIIAYYLNCNGYDASIVAWDDKKVHWNNYDILFIRSVWNSSLNYRKYCEFLLIINNLNITIINGVYNIIDNMCKKEINNIKHIIYIKNRYSKFKKDVINYINKQTINSFVLKPMIGESSYHVFRYNKNGEKNKNSKSLNYITRKIYKDNKKYGNPGIMIEKFQENIFLGEYCIYYFNNKIIYGIKKYPSVFQERKNIETINKIPSNIIKYIKSNHLILDGYGRIDLLYNDNYNDIYVMEIEKNDPDLYLRKLNNTIQKRVLNEILKMIKGELNE